MSDIPKIEIFPGINDAPVEANATEGCNGSAIVQRVNSLATEHNDVTGFWQETYNAAFQFYIDTEAGSDDNDGKTAQTAFKTWDKLVETIKVHRIDDFWWLEVYVKGTLQTPLDLRGLEYLNESVSYRPVIWVDATEDKSTFIIDTPLDDGTAHVDKRMFITGGEWHGIVIKSATIRVKSNGFGVAVGFTQLQNCDIICMNPYGDTIQVDKGKVVLKDILMSSPSTENGTMRFSVSGPGCYLEVAGTLTYVNLSSSQPNIFTAEDGAILDFNPSSVTGIPNTASITARDIGTVVSLKYYSWLVRLISPASFTFWNDNDLNKELINIHIDTAEEGQDILLHHITGNRKSIRKITLFAFSGSCTAQFKTGSTLQGTPIAVTGDNTTVFNQTYSLSASESYLKLNLTNVNALKGLSVQLELRSY